MQKSEVFAAASAYLRSSATLARIRVVGLGGSNGTPRLDLTVEADSKGKISRVKLSEVAGGKLIPTLSPSGRDYYVDNAESLTVWWAGQKRGVPLVSKESLTNPSGWWKKVLSVNHPQDELRTRVDGVGNIYLIPTRWPSPGNFLRRFLDGNVMEIGQLQTRSVVILNSRRQALGYLPWKTTFSRPDDEWILPVPNGSGFYRQEFAEKELRIYWHPLPNFKPAAPKRASKRKR